MAQLPVTTERLNEVFKSDPRSDSDIAAHFGISKQCISAWRNGTRSPKRSKLEQIANYYNKDIMWFFGFDDAKEDLVIPSEEDEQVKEILNLFCSLSTQKKTEAIRYLRYLSTTEEDE